MCDALLQHQPHHAPLREREREGEREKGWGVRDRGGVVECKENGRRREGRGSHHTTVQHSTLHHSTALLRHSTVHHTTPHSSTVQRTTLQYSTSSSGHLSEHGVDPLTGGSARGVEEKMGLRDEE